jgi:hypothetical protein
LVRKAFRSCIANHCNELTRLAEAEVRHAVEGLTVESVAGRITALGADVNKALAGISEQLGEEVRRLVAVREAIAVESRGLERLHQIDVAATALDHLVQEHERRQAELDAEIETKRAEWEQETATLERERKEQEESLKKQRQREIDEYEYKKTLERKKAQDKYDEDPRLLERKNREKQEALERDWQQREAALREGEAQVESLRKEVAQFPERLAREVERASAEATRLTEARFEQRILILEKDAEADRRVAELRVKSLEELTLRQASHLEAFAKQLEEAKRQVQTIAEKAIEGASGSNTLAHINKIAMEQAKTRSSQS